MMRLQPRVLLSLLALPLAGALQTLTFSPWEFWITGPLSLLILLWTCSILPATRLRLAGWLFGMGLFGSGASWVYISIHNYGAASPAAAFALTLIFVAGLSLFPLLAFWAWGRLAGDSLARRLWLFPAIWVFCDWVRSWLLTGFPWLYLGNAQVDGPLAGWAPLTGVHGVTFIIVASTALLFFALSRLRQQPLLAIGSLILTSLPWITGPNLAKIEWTHSAGEPLSVATMQGNIPQLMKWDPEFLGEQIRIYLEMTADDWNKDLILWPETAIPLPQDQAKPLLIQLQTLLDGEKGTLLTGIPWYGYSEDVQRMTFHNSMTAIGHGEGFYHKQRLVPFGEYVPLENWLRGLIAFFDMPMSSFTRGPANQSPLRAGDYKVMPFVCYEIAYPDFVAENARNAQVLVTVSNDAWFGDSIGPLQHLQIARMRALETQRYVLRGTNNGISALIGPDGQIIRQTAQFTREVLRGELTPMDGNTPFMETGSWPVLTLSLVLVVFTRVRRQTSLSGSGSATSAP